MKLFSFVIGMFAAAVCAVVATLALDGSWVLALVMGLVTLVAAQVLYVLLLVLLARTADDKHDTSWTKAGAKALFARRSDLGKSAANRPTGTEE